MGRTIGERYCAFKWPDRKLSISINLYPILRRDNPCATKGIPFENLKAVLSVSYDSIQAHSKDSTDLSVDGGIDDLEYDASLDDLDVLDNSDDSDDEDNLDNSRPAKLARMAASELTSDAAIRFILGRRATE
ncbi:hypothetical protein PCASD_16722 [Puccinia coronata f. sp. avenae]|uniref:Uncharacterized protein n=1 Tax=Puccinia coronata f. sp. avenae TaxID=200324 RepID=A0A2N5TXB4_9BASI|nr:hypothetical protein PCASD_16722 [Puccinia coronata f. sp. avenae]